MNGKLMALALLATVAIVPWTLANQFGYDDLSVVDIQETEHTETVDWSKNDNVHALFSSLLLLGQRIDMEEATAHSNHPEIGRYVYLFTSNVECIRNGGLRNDTDSTFCELLYRLLREACAEKTPTGGYSQILAGEKYINTMKRLESIMKAGQEGRLDSIEAELNKIKIKGRDE